MITTDILFKLAILKYNYGQSFNTISNDGENFKHGPFIMVQTTSGGEIPLGTSALEFRISKEQLEYPDAKWNCVFWNDLSTVLIFNRTNVISSVQIFRLKFNFHCSSYSAYLQLMCGKIVG